MKWRTNKWSSQSLGVFGSVVPKFNLKLGNFLELKGLSMSPYSWEQFIAVKEYNTKVAKGTGAWGKLQRKLDTSFQESYPSGVIQEVLICFNNQVWQHMWNIVYQGSSLETPVSRFSVGTGHIVILYFINTKIPDFQKVYMFSIIHTVYRTILGTMSHSWILGMVTSPSQTVSLQM